jgi:hypothetical protein
MASGERLASTTVGDISLSSEPAVALRAPVRVAEADCPETAPGDDTEARNNRTMKKGSLDGFDDACRPRRSGATAAREHGGADASAGAVPLSGGGADPIRSIGEAEQEAG